MQTTMDVAVLRGWIGRCEGARDLIAAQPARFLEATLDRVPGLGPGDALPPLWHWLYFLTAAPMRDLGRDGHPARGGFLPPVALPRRMWAGGRFGFADPLPIGAVAQKTSTVKDVTVKTGRSGALCFVTVRHEIAVGGTPCLWEEHDIVYREDPGPGDRPPPAPEAAPADWPLREVVTPDPVLLFRYSALLFNCHRIHYDRDYATGVEGHGGLVVHGPLIATLLADMAVRVSGRALSGFSFRAVAPLFDTAPFSLIARPDGERMALVAVTPDGGVAMRAEAVFQSISR